MIAIATASMDTPGSEASPFARSFLDAVDGSYEWGSAWAIPFLLGIFYLGAGYLFQAHQSIRSFRDWRAYIGRELIVLMTPFLAFTLLTLATGSLVSLFPELSEVGLVTSPHTFTGEAIVDAIFVHPVGPVGYFVVLACFMLFTAVTKTPRTRRGMLVLLACAVAVKGIAVILEDTGVSMTLPYYVPQLLGNWIWFVMGMAVRSLAFEDVLARPMATLISGITFIGGIIVLGVFGIRESALLALLTTAGLLFAYSISAMRFLRGPQDAFFGFVTKYTMAIWLMHQILARCTFCILFAIGCYPGGFFDGIWGCACALGCLIACHILPIIVMTVLSHIWKLGFIVYPARYLPKEL